jgi:SAM-dependent methyltransferase
MTSPIPDHQALIDVYAKHPLREETILARIARQRGTLEAITEFDLAHDSLTEITDQNHVGGVASVVQLALRGRVTAASRVLDIGAGLGGSARCLAHLFGCRVEGIELSPSRCAEAERLTARVELGRLVRVRSGDFLSVDVPPGQYDVIWGQGAWTHIADTAALFDRAARAIVAGGRIAFEEPCVVRATASESEADAVATLERLWGGRFLSPHAWQTALAGAGFQTIAVDQLTDAFVIHFDRLQRIARTSGAGAYPAHETEAFVWALTLANTGVIGYFRFVGHR